MIRNLFGKSKLKLDGEYRGYVVDVNDPLMLGRVRVRVWGLTESSSIPVAALPWAKPKPSLTNGSIGHYGSFWVPDLNSKVTVTFENGNHMSPVYESEAPDGLDGVPVFALTNYPHRVGFALSNGFIFWIDKSTNEVKLTHSSGTIVDITSTGDIDITSVANINVTATGNITVTATSTNFV